jgi:hypothetical protein
MQILARVRSNGRSLAMVISSPQRPGERRRFLSGEKLASPGEELAGAGRELAGGETAAPAAAYRLAAGRSRG